VLAVGGIIIERRRSAIDLALGALLVVGGLVLLGYTTWVTKMSVLYVGWMLLAFGLIGLAGAVLRIGRSGFWSTALGGALLSALGLVFLRNSELGAVTLTLLAGVVFLVGGLVRLVAAGQEPESRVPLLVVGAVSTALGLVVIFNLFTASLSMLGLILALETMSEGLVMMMFGRLHVSMEPLDGTTHGDG
jgi:uncharacterized membrane protein HdeD (DUF308 family)